MGRKGFLLAVLFFSFTSYSRLLAYQRTIEAEDCSLEPGGFQVYQNIDSYSGEGYMIILWEKNQSHGRLFKKLESSLPPGRYRLSLLTFAEGKENANQVQLVLNDASTILTWPDKLFPAGDKHWISAEVETKQEGNSFSLVVLKAHSRLILDSFRIESVPSREEKFTGPSGNLVENSSFEGLTADWFTPYQCGYALLPEYLVTGQAYHGRCSLHLPQGFTLLSRPYQVKPGEVYSLSLQVKGDQAGEVTVALTGKMGWKSFLQKKFSLTSEAAWQRLILTGRLPPDATEIMIKINLTTSAWIDAVQLQQGPVTDYQPKNPVSLGFLWKELGRVYLSGKDISWQVLFSGSSQNTVSYSYAIYDWNDRLVEEKEGEITLQQQFAEKTIKLPGEKTGIFRVRFSLPEKKELTYAVVPEYREKDSLFGAYITLKEEPLAILSRMGIRWNNTLSCGGIIGTWSLMEPEKGKFVWADEAISLTEKYGFNLLANLHTGFPRWALSSQPPEQPHLKTGQSYFKISDWQDFVRATVQHYQHRIKNWLVIDEPYHQFTPEEYARLLAVTAKVIKEIDPSARVFSHGGYSDSFLPKVIETVGTDCFDGVSDYCRRKEHAELIGSLCRKYQKIFWAVEYGGYASFYSETEPPDSIASRVSIQSLLESASRSLCWGPAARYFRYDARYPGPYPAYEKYCTMFEYDGSLKAAAVSYAVLNKLLCGYQPVGEKIADKRIKIFHFQQGQKNLLACWTTGQLYQLSLPERAKNWTVLNLMGNKVETESSKGRINFLLGPRVVYFCDLTTEDLKTWDNAMLEKAFSFSSSFGAGEKNEVLALKVSLTNTLPEKVTGSLGFSRQGQYLLRYPNQRHRFCLSPGEKACFSFDLNYGRRDILENKLCELEISGTGLDCYQTDRLSYAACFRLSFPLKVDGRFQDWQKFMDWQDNRSLKIDREITRPDKPGRLAASCLTSWDEENFYLCFQVNLAEISSGHFLRVIFQPEKESKTPFTFFFLPFPEPKLTGPSAEKIEWSYQQEAGKRYCLEMKIPWKCFGFDFPPDNSFFFNVVLHQSEQGVTTEKVWALDQEGKAGLGQIFLCKERE